MKKLRLSRPVHGVLCILGMLLILAAVRLLCGPPAAWGPKAVSLVSTKTATWKPTFPPTSVSSLSKATSVTWAIGCVITE